MADAQVLLAMGEAWRECAKDLESVGEMAAAGAWRQAAIDVKRILAAHPTSQPDRAVMQQALDALQTLHSMQSEWHADFPEHVGDKEAPAMQAARAAIAALSATMEKN